MSRNLSLIIAIIFGGLSFFLIPVTVEIDPVMFGLIKGAIGLAVFAILFFLLKKFGYLTLALTLAAIIAFAPAPYALPIDGIAKFIVALAVIAGVLALEKRLNPNDEDDEEEGV
ncbi:MAG: hypothetical protein MRZ79_00300 [Bacteroidia bacterium]|nr:hypothetical protein [Bacteroidia bacterium]